MADTIREAKALVARQYLKSGELVSEREAETSLGVRCFVTQPAMVDVEYGATFNMGNYESAKVSVRVSVPCYVEEINEAYEYARAWVDARMTVERHDIASAKGRTGL